MVTELLTGALGLVDSALLLSNLTCWLNLRRLPRLRQQRWEGSDHAPFISVLVPARNEARRIEECLHSLCRQDYPNYEVLVLDDESTDATPAILERMRTHYPERLRILRGAPLPSGWIGKSWACWQLAQAARGEWFLFVDADTSFHPHALSSIMRARDSYGWHFVSILPREAVATFIERLVIPQLLLLYFAYIPESWRRLLPSFHAASGQALLISAQLYWAIGGHAAVRTELVEDLALGRLIGRRLGAAPVADGTQVVACRMYESSAEAFAGFSKNTYPATGYRPWLLGAFLAHLFLFFVFPPSVALLGLMVGDLLWCAWGLLGYGLAAAVRWQVSRTFRLPRAQVWLQPIAVLVITAIALNSYRWSITGRLQWKGRLYRQPSP